MSLIETTLYGKINKVQKAIDRIRDFEPISNGFMDTPFYVAYSGGKDSDALRILFDLAGVPYDLVHNHTTVDAPETVRYIRTIPNIKVNKPQITMWDLIVKKRMPPTRLVRYCCSELKERDGQDRFVVTGVRWAESTKRKNNRNSLEIQMRNIKQSIMLNVDNDDSRMLFETCKLQGKRILNPIIDWTDNDVWELLNYYGCESNPLYQCGYKRVGCVGCPMSSNQKNELERYPKYRQAYIHAFERMLVKRQEDHMPTYGNFKNGAEVFEWWTNHQKQRQELQDQTSLWGELDE